MSVPGAAVTVAVLQTSRLQLQFLELSTCAQDQQLPMKFPNLHHQTGTTEVEHRTPTSFSACPGCRWPLDDLPSIMQAILVFLIHVNTHIHVIFLYRICLLYKHREFSSLLFSHSSLVRLCSAFMYNLVPRQREGEQAVFPSI